MSDNIRISNVAKGLKVGTSVSLPAGRFNVREGPESGRFEINVKND